MIESTWSVIQRVRERAPLIHNITNFVVMNTTANALLAIGASPVMAHAVEEVEELTASAGALVVNIGTLSSTWIAAMRLSARKARDVGTPWVLDPVGVGATALRNQSAASLLALRPNVVRGNGSEILALAGAHAATKGVDSTAASSSALDAARSLARESGGVVAVTGVIDYVTDGQRVLECRHGHPLMARVTGLGCTASALVAAFLAVESDALTATHAALTMLGVAGELAAANARGPGSLQQLLLDALYNLDEPTLAAQAGRP